MGLDVYLYRYENLEEYNLLQDRYELEASALWQKVTNGKTLYSEASTEETDRYSLELDFLKSSYGKNEDSDLPGRENIEINSLIHPDHMYKIGYFRSSYNESGLNSKLRTWLGEDLSSIFNPSEKYIFSPNWSDSKQKARAVLEKLKNYFEESGHYDVIKLQPSLFSQPGSSDVDSDKKALDIFLKEVESRKKSKFSFTDYSNSFGTFSFGEEPIKVRGVINGSTDSYVNSFNKRDCFYLIVEGTGEGRMWYLNALDVVVETCDYVLAKSDPEKYYLHWSG